nr:hypothetical protein [Tanacetum cinerariifolium]
MQTQTFNTLHNAIMEAGGKDRPPMLAPDKTVPVSEGSYETTTVTYMENYKNVSQDIRDQLNVEAEAVQIILTGIDNDIYSTVDACPNACEMWKAIERFYKMMNELVRNQCDVTNHQVNVQFLLQLQSDWQRFVTLVKQSQELKTVSYHKLYDILKQHKNEVNELRAERIALTDNPLALVAQQQPNKSDNSLRINRGVGYDNQRLGNVAGARETVETKKGKGCSLSQGKDAIELEAHYMYMAQIQEVSPDAADSGPIFDAEPLQKIDKNNDNDDLANEHDETSKDKEIDKLMALISLSFKKIYKPTNNNLRTSSNTSRANQDNSPRINKSAGYENQMIGNVAGAREIVGLTAVQKFRIQCYNCKEFGHVARECQKLKWVKDVAYHREKMLLCKQEDAGIQLNVEQADWRDDTDDDELENQELEVGVNPLIDHHCCYECRNSLNGFFCYQCTCEFCGNSAHVGYNCPAQVPSLQTLPIFPRQYPCCEDCGVTHEPYQCQPKNHDYYHEQNSFYDSNSFGFDHGQPPQYTINHPIFNAHNKQEEKRIEEEQAAKAQNSKIPVCYDDDYDYSAITPNEPVDSLSMEDEHLDTIPATESDEFIKSCVETLVPNPSESEGENGCDVPVCFTTFSNTLFDAEYESDSSDYQSCSDEDFSEEILSNPLFEEEIISIKIDQHHFNDESDLIESMLNHDSSIISSSSKIDSLLDEFTVELTLLKSIPPGIDETDCYPEDEIHFTERLLYDNSSPRPPKEFVSKNSDDDIESFSPSPIPDEDSDSHMEEIDLPFNPDDPIPSSIEDDDYNSERDILIPEEFPSNYSLSLPVNESFDFDIPTFSSPPAKPPDGNTEILNIKMMGDVSVQSISGNLKTLAKGFYPSSLHFLSFSWESCI